MKKVRVSGSGIKSTQNIIISGSKSESNRILILNSIFKNISIKNLSSSDDTKVLHQILNSQNSDLNVGHAGTSMRFLSAYLATIEKKKFILSGSERMHKRPISILVKALNDLGFNISYLENKGFPPLKIFGGKNTKNKVKLKANVSSQYISALMLIAPSLYGGLIIELDGQVTSKPYIKMTLSILHKLGIDSQINNNLIKVAHHNEIDPTTYEIESDWSSLSYFFSIVALSNNIELSFLNFRSDSYQGDINLCKLYELFGVNAEFEKNKLIIKKNNNFTHPKKIILDLNDNPDLAQTILVTAFGLNIPIKITGLSTLKVKETDRLEAMYNELTALGASSVIDGESIEIFERNNKLNKDHVINTYDDHRMALAFAPLSVIFPIQIYNPNVVSKSFPEFWKILEKIKFSISYL